MKTLLLSSLALIINIVTLTAQTKSTGAVNLLSNMTAEISLDKASNKATLTFTGPTDRWFALQFGDFSAGSGMSNGEDIVYFNGSTLVDAVHNGVGIPPSVDRNDWTLISNTASSGIRTIIATRAFSTGDSNDYVFNYNNTAIDFAFSRSQTVSYNLAYHGFANRGYAINNKFTDGALSIDDNEFNLKQITLVPNPATTSFMIKTDFEQNIINTSIYNALGQKVLSVNNNISRIDVSGLASGNYYVQIETGLGVVPMKKLLIK